MPDDLLLPHPHRVYSDDPPKAPKHLRPATRRWWRVVTEVYELEEHHLKLLQFCCESWDRAAEAREILAKEGLTYTDRFGCPRSRPEIAVERDSRIAFARMLRELDIDAVDEPHDRDRPPALRSNRRARM